jgi:chemotaxis methyl-accepting protein methylase
MEMPVHDREGENPAVSTYVNYSEFFRNPLTFAVLEKIVLPDLIRRARELGRRELRIWSAGCAGGQEVYSVAMLLEELFEKSQQTFDYRIFATDAREAHIALGRSGVFNSDSLDTIGLKRLNRWFSPQGTQWAVSPLLAEHIDFSVFDLLDGELRSPPASIFGAFDMVICCNVIFYYKPERREIILNKLTKCLGEEAYLVTGETERGFILENGFREVCPQSAVFSKILKP